MTGSKLIASRKRPSLRRLPAQAARVARVSKEVMSIVFNQAAKEFCWHQAHARSPVTFELDQKFGSRPRSRILVSCFIIATTCIG